MTRTVTKGFSLSDLPERPVRFFSHGGKLGDIVYALPAIRGAGGGSLVLYPTQVRPLMYMQPIHADFLRSLFTAQDYIDTVSWSPTVIGFDFEVWRLHYYPGLTIAAHKLKIFDLPLSECETPWIKAQPYRVAGTVFCRSARYRNPKFPWKEVHAKYDDAVFIGTPDEHRDFEREIGEVPYYPARDAMDIAQAIAGADLFVGNQTFVTALAEAMKVRLVMEVAPDPFFQNCIYPRDGAIYGFDEHVLLP